MMWFKSINSRGDFIFQKEGLKIFELKFPKWYSHRAVVIFGKSNIEIKPKSIWKNEYIILKNNQKKGSIISNWKGAVSIQFFDELNHKHNFQLISKGFLKQRFEIYNDKMSLLTIVTLSVNWKKLSSDYELENKSNSLEEKHFNELMIYTGFYVIIHKKNTASSVSGGAV